MERLTFIEVENELGKILVDKEDIEKATYLPNCVVIDKEAIEEFKEKFGIDLNKLYQEGRGIEEIKEKFEKEKKYDIVEDIEDFIDNLSYLPQCCDSIYCEDIILKEDLDEVDGLIYDKEADVLSLPEDFEDVMEDYYIYWDGRNHRCNKVEEIIEIEAEKVERWNIEEELGIEIEEDGDVAFNKAHYNYYKTFYNGKPIYFRVYVSHYQGSLPVLDEEWEYTDYELLEALFYNCIPYKELQEIDIIDSKANALCYEINNKLKGYLLEDKNIKPFSVKFLTDKEHKLLFVDLCSLETKRYILFVNILNKLGYKLDFTKCCKKDVALIEKKEKK